MIPFSAAPYICFNVIRWQLKLFVMPSQQVWYTGIALAGTCLIGAIIVGALHLHEKVGKRNASLYCIV